MAGMRESLEKKWVSATVSYRRRRELTYTVLRDILVAFRAGWRQLKMKLEMVVTFWCYTLLPSKLPAEKNIGGDTNSAGRCRDFFLTYRLS